MAKLGNDPSRSIAGNAATKEGAKSSDSSGADRATTRVQAGLSASFQSAVVVGEYFKLANPEHFGALVATLSGELELQLSAGDMKRAEAMLFGQAHALQAMFTSLARLATLQTHLAKAETYTRMALKAQNQSRMTLETLATIKNPPVVIARQANINHGGQQQVNNGPNPARSVPRAHDTPAGNSATEKTELLEESDGQRLDTRAAGATGGTHSHMDAVGVVDGPANR